MYTSTIIFHVEILYTYEISLKYGLSEFNELYAIKYGEEKKCAILTIIKMSKVLLTRDPLKNNTKLRPRTTPGIANENIEIKCKALVPNVFVLFVVKYAAK